MPALQLAWAGLGVALLLLALVVALLARQWWLESGLPSGRVFYSDTGTWYPQSDVLYSDHYRLAGRPDYLVEQPDGTILPVEVKSAAAPKTPYPGHVLQLAAYCLLVEETYGIRPEQGIIQYKDRAFAVTYTRQMEDDLLDVLEEMWDDLYAGDVDRDHSNWQRCGSCGHRRHCEQSLA